MGLEAAEGALTLLRTILFPKTLNFQTHASMASHHRNANNALINLERSYKPTILTLNLSAPIYLQAYLLPIYHIFATHLAKSSFV